MELNKFSIKKKEIYICGNFTFEALNLHHEKSTLEKIVPQGLIRNTEYIQTLSVVTDLLSYYARECEFRGKENPKTPIFLRRF